MKLVTICFGFHPDRIRTQPRRYIHELIKDLHRTGTDVTVITDSESDGFENIDIRYVDNLQPTMGPSDELVSAIKSEQPDVVATILGASSFIRPISIAKSIPHPVIGIMTSPYYRFKELTNIGLREFYRHHEEVKVHFLGSLAPRRLVQHHISSFDQIITLTAQTKERLKATGASTNIDVLRPGLDDFDLTLPDQKKVRDVRTELSDSEEPIILYYTSPITLRGTDTLVRAFKKVRQDLPSKLVILSRQDKDGSHAEERYLSDLANNLGVGESFEIIPKNLTPEGVKLYLSAAHLVCLPFKMVISSVPISILETMALGKPLITTKTAGLPELVPNDQQLVAPNSVNELSSRMKNLLADPKTAHEIGKSNRKRMEAHPSWNAVRETFSEILQGVYDD